MKRALPVVSLFLVAALVVPLAAKPAKAPKAPKGPNATKISGVVAKVDATSLTVTAKKGKGAPEEKTIEIGPSTKVQVETAEYVTSTDKKGKEVKRPKVADGALTDVTAGKHVTVTIAEDGKKAVSILVQREHAKKKRK